MLLAGLVTAYPHAAAAPPAHAAAASAWSRPVLIARPSAAAHDAKAVWTANGGLVAVANLQQPESLSAFRSRGSGAFTPFGDLAPANKHEYALAALPGGGAITAFAEGSGVSTATSSGSALFAPAEGIPGSELGAFPSLAVAPNADVYALWETARCDSGCPAVNTVRVAVRPASSGRFEPAQQLSRPGVQAALPQIVTDGRGGALAAWLSISDGGTVESSRIDYAIRPPGGTFGRVRALEPHAGATGFRMAASGAGRVVAIWNRIGGAPVRVATGNVANGFGRSRGLGGPRGGGGEVALGRGGAGIVGWTEGGRQRQVRVALVRSGNIGRPRTLAHGPAHTLDVAVDAHGRRLVAWRELGHGTRSIHVALSERGGPWSHQVIERGRSLFYSLAPTSNGHLLIAWLVSLHDGWHVRAASAPPGRPFGPTTQLDTRRDSPSIPRVAAGPGSRAAVYWPQDHKRGGDPTVVLRYYRP